MMDSVTLGGGCFWCIDAVFRQLRGVTSVVSGYSGGASERPTYYAVASGQTEHAEAVQVTYDPAVIDLDTLLDIFFLIHDPTTKDQQGADIGTQYRSVLFYANDQQKDIFLAAIARAQKVWNDPIETTLEPLTTFYPAEEEHQDYFAKQPASGYCSVVIQPKIIKARAHYKQWFKTAL